MDPAQARMFLLVDLQTLLLRGCHVTVSGLCLFLVESWVGLQCMIVAFAYVLVYHLFYMYSYGRHGPD